MSADFSVVTEPEARVRQATKDTLSESEFRHFAEVIETELGIRIPDGKRAMLEARLSKRLRRLSLSDLGTYYQFFFSEGGEEERRRFLADIITTNKSDFFREPAHFAFLEKWLSEQSEEYKGRPLRVWSAGCATGEEPYTIAMVLSRFTQSHPEFNYFILASDASQAVLDEALRGVYPVSKLATVPVHYRNEYFLRSRDPVSKLVRVAPEIRAQVRFMRLNFMAERYMVGEPFDLIFFRNVMIYFERRTQETVLTHLCRHLRTGGYFLPGHTESLNGFKLPLRALAPAIYRKLSNDDE